MENYQKASVEKGNISDSNNRNEAGRDVIFKYGDESYIDKELQASQDNIIAAQARLLSSDYNTKSTECKTKWKYIKRSSLKRKSLKKGLWICF